MTQLLAAVALIISATFGAFAAAAPCEDMLSQLRAAEANATLGDADKASVADLEAKGIERCNADDDRRADDFFAQAMKIVGK